MSQSFYSYMVYILPESDLTLASLKEKLEKFFSYDKNLKIKSSEKQIILTFEDGYSFNIILNENDYVKVECQEMSEYKKLDYNDHPFDKEKLKKSSSRLELWGDEDYDMEYFNESLYILKEIETFKNIVIFSMN